MENDVQKLNYRETVTTILDWYDTYLLEGNLSIHKSEYSTIFGQKQKLVVKINIDNEVRSGNFKDIFDSNTVTLLENINYPENVKFVKGNVLRLDINLITDIVIVNIYNDNTDLEGRGLFTGLENGLKSLLK